MKSLQSSIPPMKNKTVFILGAGSTQALRVPTSKEHIKIFQKAANNNDLLQKLYDITESRFNNKEYGINDVYNLIDNALMLQVGLTGGGKHIEYIELLKAKKELICAIFTEILQRIEKYDKKLYEKYVDFYYRLAKKELEISCAEKSIAKKENFSSQTIVLSILIGICTRFFRLSKHIKNSIMKTHGI